MSIFYTPYKYLETPLLVFRRYGKKEYWPERENQ